MAEERMYEEVLDNIGLGMYQGAAITDVPAEAATLLKNMVIKHGRYVGSRRGFKRHSRSVIKSNDVAVPFTGLYEYNRSTTRRLLAKAGANLYTYDHDTGQFTDTLVDLDEDSKAHFTRYWDSVIISDGVNYPIRYNGTTFTELSSAPKFRVSEPINGNLFGVDVSGEPDKTYFSSVLDPTTWPATYVRGVPESTFDTLKCIRKVNDSVLALAFAEEEIWTMTGTSNANYRFYSLAKGCGTVAAETVQTMNGRVIWLDQDGFYTIGENGIPVKFIQLNEVFKSLDMSRLSSAWSVGYRGNVDTGNQYWCGITLGSGMSRNNYIFVYDFSSGGWVMFTGVPCDIMTVGLDSNRNEVLYGLSDDGIIYQLDTGFNDNGSSMSNTYISRPFNFGDAQHEKILQDIVIFYRSKYPATFNILITADTKRIMKPSDGTPVSYDINGEPSPAVQYELDALESTTHFLRKSYFDIIEHPIGLRGRYFQVLISCKDAATDFDIYKIIARGPVKAKKTGQGSS